MTESSPTTMPDPYCVKTGDTLTAIAKRSGRPMADLMRFNKLTNPNKLSAGQTLYLSEHTAFGVSVLFLDALRHPIENLAYRLIFDGKQVTGTTGKSGTAPRQTTQNAQSTFSVWIQNIERQWQQVTQTFSGHGHKLITAVSSDLVVQGQTEPHPAGAPAKPASPSAAATPAAPAAQAPAPKPAAGTPSKNNPAVKTKKARARHGQSVVQISIDLPEGLMTLFQQYTGQKITETDWNDAANAFGCEVEVLKAIAQVESHGAGFWKINSHNLSGVVPAILFERHYFHRLTCANGPHMNTREHTYHGIGVPGCHSPYDQYPDLCFPNAFVSRLDRHNHATLGTANARMPTGAVTSTDQYGDSQRSYLRLINAYRLDANAALQSCSWGMFQIMGEEHLVSCGVVELKDFMSNMCTGESGQMRMFRNFIEHKAGGRLLAAVRSKDWAKIAYYYNGPGYQNGNYDTKIRTAYEALKHTA